MKTKPEEKGWEKEFDEKFMRDGELLMPVDGIDDAKDIKAFIRKTLSTKLQRACERVELLRKDTKLVDYECPSCENDSEECDCYKYNEAVDDAQAVIKEIMKEGV